MIIDSHAHLDMKEFDSDRDAVIKRAIETGVEKIVSVGVDLESSHRAVELSQNYPNVYAAVGIQPEEIDQYFGGGSDSTNFNPQKIRTDVRLELEKLTLNKKVVAIGECGLDYKYIREKSPSAKASGDLREKQKDIFRRQLGTAVLLDLPIIIHNREADEDVISEILRYKDTKKLRGVFHCFTGTLEFAHRIIDLGFMISFTGIITYPKNGELRKVVREIPLDKIMVETDSPFLSPQPHRGERNEPALVTEIVKSIAKIKGGGLAEVARTTTTNAINLFGLDSRGELS